MTTAHRCLQGVETMLDDMVRADADWPRLQQVPNLTDGWPDVKDKFGIAMEEFKVGCPQAQWPAQQSSPQKGV